MQSLISTRMESAHFRLSVPACSQQLSAIVNSTHLPNPSSQSSHSCSPPSLSPQIHKNEQQFPDTPSFCQSGVQTYLKNRGKKELINTLHVFLHVTERTVNSKASAQCCSTFIHSCAHNIQQDAMKPQKFDTRVFSEDPSAFTLVLLAYNCFDRDHNLVHQEKQNYSTDFKNSF